MRMRVVAYDLKVFKLVVVDTCWLTLKNQLRQRARLPSKLQLNLLNMIQVNMRVTHGNYNFANSQIALLCEHMS